MHQFFIWTRILRRTPLNQMIGSRFIFLVSYTGFMICLFWIQLDTPPPVSDNLIQEALEIGSIDARYSEIYRKKDRLSKDLKYMLLWTSHDYAPFYYLGKGQKAFIQNNCSVINCYVTDDRKFFSENVDKFDAIAFNGRNMLADDLPAIRKPHQKYIFFNMESSANYPVCNSKFDGFFNWTASYKLNSDIPFTYLYVKNKEGEIIGPRTDMKWPDKYPEVDEIFATKLMNKTTAAAWFVSNCHSKSDRDRLVKRLKKALEQYKLTVDIYGSCGELQCPVNNNDTSSCETLLERKYFFYMSLENSFCDDYVTEKLLRPLQHNAVPIVYGGAKYSRFAPPGSYIDARKYSVPDLAAILARLMKDPDAYRSFFKWKKLYSYVQPHQINVCAVCEALNNKEMMETDSVYKDFREWWNPNFQRNCR